MNGTTFGTLNIQRFFETLAQLVGEQHHVKITITSIRRRDETALPVPGCNAALPLPDDDTNQKAG